MSASIGSTDHPSTNACSGPQRSFYTFSSHDRTIKRFPRIAFPFAGFHVSSAFVGNFNGSLGLMLPDGFSGPIPGFENPDRQARRDTPYLTPSSSFDGSATPSRGALAFALGSHDSSKR